MESNVNIIAKSLFAKNSFDEVTEEQLLDYTHAYPYTGIGHFLLAKRKKDKGEPYQAAAAKASLYFNNPLWLHYLLESYPEDIEVPELENVPEVPVVQEVPEEESEVHDEKVIVEVESVEKVAEPVIEMNEAVVASHESEPVELHVPILVKEAAITPVSTDETAIPAVPTDSSVPAAHSVAPSLEEPLFEPYHTIDYFASQGIKLRLEDLEKDKFGKQLRSFTDWLRTMKKIAPVVAGNPVAEPQQDPSEAEIQKVAAESVEASDVETEAMAEVWVKQGKKTRAAAIYRKLSLLNPGKSHYFAAKIDQLND
ncbi:MAG: hypothetical protein IPP79_07245 [Chitinophagaceae bacterium]|nr:hypothetical protein [Chitinophagaceae bacterium]